MQFIGSRCVQDPVRRGGYQSQLPLCEALEIHGRKKKRPPTEFKPPEEIPEAASEASCGFYCGRQHSRPHLHEIPGTSLTMFNWEIPKTSNPKFFRHRGAGLLDCRQALLVENFDSQIPRHRLQCLQKTWLTKQDALRACL